METIIPISVEDANTEVLEKITKLMVDKYNRTMQIDLYHGQGSDCLEPENDKSSITQEICNLLGKGGQPYFIISSQPNTAS